MSAPEKVVDAGVTTHEFVAVVVAFESSARDKRKLNVLFRFRYGLKDLDFSSSSRAYFRETTNRSSEYFISQSVMVSSFRSRTRSTCAPVGARAFEALPANLHEPAATPIPSSSSDFRRAPMCLRHRFSNAYPDKTQRPEKLLEHARTRPHLLDVEASQQKRMTGCDCSDLLAEMIESGGRQCLNVSNKNS